jgi:hypothetical protein
MVQPGEMIVIWFSCGAASAVAAYKTIEKYGKTNIIRVVNNPVKEEDSDNLRFLKDIEKWLGLPIESAINSKYPSYSAEDVWIARSYMSGLKGAPCTVALKKEARHEWETINKPDWHVLGFTSDEIGRFNRFKLMERSNTIGVLIEEGLSKQDCYDILILHGIQPPLMYDLGYPNANCPGCVKATSPTYWNHVRRVHPLVFAARAILSRKLGVRLVRYKGKRIFLDELPETASGRSLKTMQIDCGIFCDIQKSLNP